MSEKIKVLLSEEEVDARIKQIAAQISRDYAGREIHLICRVAYSLPVNWQRELLFRYPLILCQYPAMVMIQNPVVL